MATLIRPAKNNTYYINPSSLTFVENSGYGVQLIQVSASSSCYISVLDKENGIYYTEDSEIRKWKITAYNNKFPDGDTTSWNIYIRLERAGVSALVVYDKKERAVNGGVISITADGVTQIGEADPSFYYIKIGTVGETDGVSKIREIVYDTGYLNTPESNQATGELFYSMFRPHFDNPDNPEELTWIEALSNLGVAGGVSSYIKSKGMDIPSIYDGLPIDWSTIYWEEVTNADGTKTRVLKARGGSGEGGGSANLQIVTDLPEKPVPGTLYVLING